MDTLRNRHNPGHSDPSDETEKPTRVIGQDEQADVSPVSSLEKTVEAHGQNKEADLEKSEVPRSASIYADEDGPREGDGDDDPELRDIPWAVRRVVSLHDNPHLPTLTFRYFLLTFLFVAPGAFLSQLSSFRTTASPYSVFFVQIASNYAGLWLADLLPQKRVKIPFTGYGFDLNPGPWSVKEHVLVTISAAYFLSLKSFLLILIESSGQERQAILELLHLPCLSCTIIILFIPQLRLHSC